MRTDAKESKKELTPPCIVQKNPQVTNTVQQVVCHPVNNSTGKWSSIPPHKTRPDFLYQLCRETAIRVSTSDRKPRRGNMRFLPPLEMRLSSIAPNPVESREAPPNSTVPLTSQRHPEKLHEVTGKIASSMDSELEAGCYRRWVPVRGAKKTACERW